MTRNIPPGVSVDQGTAKVNISFTCSMCQKTHYSFEMAMHIWMQFLNSKITIEKIPNLTLGERECLLSGICGECFDDMFADKYPDEAL